MVWGKTGESFRVSNNKRVGKHAPPGFWFWFYLPTMNFGGHHHKFSCIASQTSSQKDKGETCQNCHFKQRLQWRLLYCILVRLSLTIFKEDLLTSDMKLLWNCYNWRKHWVVDRCVLRGWNRENGWGRRWQNLPRAVSVPRELIKTSPLCHFKGTWTT